MAHLLVLPLWLSLGTIGRPVGGSSRAPQPHQLSAPRLALALPLLALPPRARQLLGEHVETLTLLAHLRAQRAPCSTSRASWQAHRSSPFAQPAPAPSPAPAAAAPCGSPSPRPPVAWVAGAVAACAVPWGGRAAGRGGRQRVGRVHALGRQAVQDFQEAALGQLQGLGQPGARPVAHGAAARVGEQPLGPGFRLVAELRGGAGDTCWK